MRTPLLLRKSYRMTSGSTATGVILELKRATPERREMQMKGSDKAMTGKQISPLWTLRTIPFAERAVQVKLFRTIHGKRRSKKNLEGFYEVPAPISTSIKVNPLTSTIKRTKQGNCYSEERPTTLKVYADRRGPRASKKLIDEQILSHLKLFARKLKGDNKMKHCRRETGSGVSSSRSNISRAMLGRIPKIQISPLCETSALVNKRTRRANSYALNIRPFHQLFSKLHLQLP